MKEYDEKFAQGLDTEAWGFRGSGWGPTSMPPTKENLRLLKPGDRVLIMKNPYRKYPFVIEMEKYCGMELKVLDYPRRVPGLIITNQQIELEANLDDWLPETTGWDWNTDDIAEITYISKPK